MNVVRAFEAAAPADLSLYVHVPFCTRRCPYCSFYHVHAGGAAMRRAVRALVTELDRTLGPPESAAPVRTVFVGGGTPTVLTDDALDELLGALQRRTRPGATVEFTVEVNPEDATDETFERLRRRGVDRVSLGVQSLDEAAQRTLGRCSPEVNLRALRAARRCFERVSADVLLGVPGLSFDAFRASVRKLIERDDAPTHVSAYILEDGGDVAHAVRPFFERVDVDAAAEQYLWLHEYLVQAGFEHYEVSNFGRHRSEHNRAYWTGRPYVGVGPAAHSYVDGRRVSNPADLRAWLEGVERNAIRRIVDERTDEDVRLERAMLAMRQSDGVPRSWCRCAEATLDELRADGLLTFGAGAPSEGGRVRATARGFLVLDELVLRLDIHPPRNHA